jgi:hypothetical protein
VIAERSLNFAVCSFCQTGVGEHGEKRKVHNEGLLEIVSNSNSADHASDAPSVTRLSVGGALHQQQHGATEQHRKHRFTLRQRFEIGQICRGPKALSVFDLARL